MSQTTLLCIFNSEGQLLLAMKKRGFGAGKWNGPGGKVQTGESIEAACKREALEEVGLSIGKMESCGFVDFVFQKPEGDKRERCYIFRTNDYTGEPIESEEMKPAWWELDKIPWKEMWDGDEHWFKNVIHGETVYATCTFDPDFHCIAVEKLDPTSINR